MRLGPSGLGQLLVEGSNPLKTRLALVGDGPLPEEDVAFCPDIGVDHVVAGEDTEPLEERLVGKCALETRASILNQPIENSQSAELTVHAAVFAGVALLGALVFLATWERTVFSGLHVQPLSAPIPGCE